MAQIPRTLFVGIGASGVAWYRAALPAMALGADWCGVRGTPPEIRGVAGDVAVRGAADLHGYDVVVLQQPRGREWLQVIRSLQADGATVLFEVDDLVEAVRKASDHDHRDTVDRDWVRDVELTMRVCDGVICSTPYLARRYRAINPSVAVCRNGIDLRRYAVTRVPGEQVTIGWAGATGHRRAVEAWLPAVRSVMAERPGTRFISIGQSFADELADEFGPERCISLPFAMLETYPAAMANLDIALAPAGATNFFRAKSDLRWLEASALGIPVVADPHVYPDIEHGVTGFHAATPQQARSHLLALVDDGALRARVGEAARAVVRETRAIEVMAGQWREVIVAAASTPAVA